MNINDLTLFVRAAELKNITRASDELGYTQSAGSHIINRLERELGIALLIRSRNGVTLTSAGNEALQISKELISGQRALSELSKKYAEKADGCVRVGGITSVAAQWLPDLTSDFCQQYPKVKVQIFDGNYTDVEKWISEKTIDCGFVPGTSICAENGWPVRQDSLYVVLPKDHELCAFQKIPVEMLKNRKFLIPEEGMEYDVGKIISSAGMIVSEDTHSVSDYVAISMVRQGYGITIMPELLLNGFCLEDIELRPLDYPYARTIYIAVGSGRQSVSTKAFIDFALAWFE